MNIAITGSSGFIGSHITKMVYEMGHNVIVISSKKKISKNIDNYFTFEEFFSSKIKMNIDCMIHLASPNYDYADDDSLKEGITLLTSKILDSLEKYNCQKLIFFSTAKIYGEPSFKPDSFSEESPINAVTDYGKEKFKTEENIISFAKASKLNYLIYRLPLVYGSNMNSNIGKLLNLIDKSYPVPLFRNTKQFKKSFLSIKNIKLCIKHNINDLSSINNNVLNLSDLNPISIEEFILSYKNLVKSKSIVIKFPNLLIKVMSKARFLKTPLEKLYGSFEIKNNKVRYAYNIKILTTTEGLKDLINNKKDG